jgi:hypothetical protein
MAVRLGELLLREKRVTPVQLQEALNHQRQHGGRLGASLVKLGILADDEITAAISRQCGVPSINLADFDLDPGVVRLIPVESATKYSVVPVGKSGTTLTLAMADPTNVFAMDDIKFMTGLHIEPVVASETAIREAITRLFTATTKGTADSANLPKAADLADRALKELGTMDDAIEVVAGHIDDWIEHAASADGGGAAISRFWSREEVLTLGDQFADAVREGLQIFVPILEAIYAGLEPEGEAGSQNDVRTR